YDGPMKLWARAALVAVLLAPLVGFAKPSCKQKLGGGFTISGQGDLSDIRKYARKTLDFIGDALEVPDFYIEVRGRDSRNETDIYKNEIFIGADSKKASVAHEIGHVVFADYLRAHAPKAFKAMKDSKPVKAADGLDYDELGGYVNSYAEQFCDLL